MDNHVDCNNAPPVLSTSNDTRPTLKHHFAGKIQKAAQRMTAKTVEVLLSDFTAGELWALKEICCDGCKGVRWFEDSNCRFHCDGFVKETLEYLQYTITKAK